MTEERIIVTTSSEVVWLLKKQGSIIHPAPPKGWLPMCWVGNPKTGCTDVYYDENGALSKTCRECPYRNMEDAEQLTAVRK